MTRRLGLVLAVFGLPFAAPACAVTLAGAFSPADDPAEECYSQVGPVLKRAGGKLTPEVRKAYLDWAEATVLAELGQAKKAVPAGCLNAVRQDAELRDAIFGAVYPPDPSVLQNYAYLSAELGPRFVADYRSLVVAMAVAKRAKGVETLPAPGSGKDFGRDYQAGFWGDETIIWPSEYEKQLVRGIADFMKEKQVAALDLYKDATLRKQLADFLTEHGMPADLVAETKNPPQLGERLKAAMVLLGQRPAAREPKPTTVEWLRYLVSIVEATPKSTPIRDGRPMPWPWFPLRGTPWPLLMPLAHSVPLSEARYIWAEFQGEQGPSTYRDYGPYRDDASVMPFELNPSQWFWDAWPDRMVHGGACVPLSKGTVDFYSALGKPAMWAGQPGHANLVSFYNVGGAWVGADEQAWCGGPDVTCAQWYFDEDPGTMAHARGLYDWPFAEYHLGLALAMNVGVGPYMDTRIAANILRVMPAEERKRLGVKLLADALQANPFNPEIWYRLAQQTSDAMQCYALVVAAKTSDPGLLTGRPSSASLQEFLEGERGKFAAYRLDEFRRTLEQFVAQFSILSHAPPRREADMRSVYTFLKSVPGVGADQLAAYADQFRGSGPGEIQAQELDYDRILAEQGDPFGQMRMGLRYRDGDGLPPDMAKAKELLTKAAAQGDPAAAIALARFNPAIAVGTTVAASSVFGPDQLAVHLVDGSGMVGAVHDNEGGARTMWHTSGSPEPTRPAAGLAPSPAWVRFDFPQSVKFDTILIWNHNQAGLTDRGFRMTHIYASSDGVAWFPFASSERAVLPRASGAPFSFATVIENAAPGRPIKSVIVAADAVEGNYGSNYYGLSAVHFAVHPMDSVIPASEIAVSASSTYAPEQGARHLTDGTGMFGRVHDNHFAAYTMWHTPENPAPTSPAAGLAASPAWVRFDFAQPVKFDTILIWNHNQVNLTNRGFRQTRIYGTSDGAVWFPLTSTQDIELPRADGSPFGEAVAIRNATSDRPIKSVIVAAEAVDGNYGGNCYGLSAVRFVVH